MLAPIILLSQLMAADAPPAGEGVFSLLKQEFTLSIEPAKGSVSAQVAWHLENDGPGHATQVLIYLADMAELSAIEAPGRTVTWKRLPALIPFFSAARVRFAKPVPAGDRITVLLRYHIVRTIKQTGLGALSMSLGPTAVYLFESWYPTLKPFIDVDTFIRKVPKTPFSLEVTVPRGFTGVTVGTRKTKTDKPQTCTFTYECDGPPPLLIPLLVARFTRQVVADMEIPVELYAAAPVAEARSRELCGFVAKAAGVQARLLQRQPPATLTVVLLDSGGIARGFPGLLVLPPYLPSYWEDPLVKSTICHELSHTYFGNLVSAYGPGGNEFLSEGLATFIGVKTVGILDDREAEQRLFRRMREEFFASEVQDVAIVHVRPMQNVLSGEVYKKGALVFNELSRWLGEKKLWELLSAYLRDREGGHATVADFRRVAQKRSGRDLAPFFTQYLETTDLPWVDVTSFTSEQAGPDRWRTVVRLRNRGTGFGLAPVGLAGAGGSRPDVRTELCLVPAGTEKTFTVETPYEVASCQIDPDGTFLHGVRRASLLRRAKDLRQKGRLDQARATYEKLAALLPEDGEIWYGLGRAEQSAGRNEAAVACYEKAAAFGGTSWLPTWAWLREAACRRTVGDLTRARELLQRVIDEGQDIYGAQEEARRGLRELKE